MQYLYIFYLGYLLGVGIPPTVSTWVASQCRVASRMDCFGDDDEDLGLLRWSPDQISTLKARFKQLDADNDGVLTKDEFSECLGLLRLNTVLAKLIFDSFDTDHDGAWMEV